MFTTHSKDVHQRIGKDIFWFPNVLIVAQYRVGEGQAAAKADKHTLELLLHKVDCTDNVDILRQGKMFNDA